MGLFGGNKDEINVKLLSGQIKAVIARSFMGGSLENESGGDSAIFAQRYFFTPQLYALGSHVDHALAIVSVSRYGTLTVELFCSRTTSPEKQTAFPQIQASLEDKGYQVFCTNQRDQYSSASITIIKDGSTKATWKDDLGRMLNDVSMLVLRVLDRY